MNYENQVAEKEAPTSEKEVNVSKISAAEALKFQQDADNHLDELKASDSKETATGLDKTRAAINNEAAKAKMEAIEAQINVFAEETKSLEALKLNPEVMAKAKLSLLAVSELINKGEELLAQAKPGSEAATTLSRNLRSLSGAVDFVVTKGATSPMYALGSTEKCGIGYISSQLEKEYAQDNKLNIFQKAFASRSKAYEHFLNKIVSDEANKDFIGQEISKEDIKKMADGYAAADSLRVGGHAGAQS